VDDEMPHGEAQFNRLLHTLECVNCSSLLNSLCVLSTEFLIFPTSARFTISKTQLDFNIFSKEASQEGDSEVED
jgi:hypothetical protein